MVPINIVSLFLAVFLSTCLGGCGDQVQLPTEWELNQFNAAGPVSPLVDKDSLVRARMASGPYRIIPGDALELDMPGIMWFVVTREIGTIDRITPYSCRVAANGTITLPIAGQLEAAGKTLSQIELDVIDAYYPKHVVSRPSVFARVLEYSTVKVSISGAVLRPGVYNLRSDQMSIVALIMEAGGIIDEGASLIRITHYDELQEANENTSGSTAQKKSKPVVLPIKGMNIPFADVALQEGDSVVVERLEPPMITVMGLVTRPGNFPYPPDTKYNLMQAIAFAGGLNLIAEPRYATVYRLNVDGTTTSAAFQITDGSKLIDAANTPIKPGDIVDVQQTPRTRTALFIDRIFRINVGTYWSLQDRSN